MLEMKRQDLEELYQLLSMYRGVYRAEEAGGILEEVRRRYRERYGEDIREKRNPRKAGRKKKYTEEQRRRIRELREEGQTIREIAKETGCSVGYVQDVLSDP